MNKLRNLAFLFFSGLSFLATAEDLKENINYKVLEQPIATVSAGNTINISSIFSYGCPHCYSLAKIQAPWEKGLAKDVELKEVPVVFGKAYQAHAQLFYALEELNLLEKAHFPIFEAVQKQNRRLDDEKEIADFMSSSFGVDKEDFKRAYSQFNIRKQTQKASTMTRGAKLMGVPAIIVDGKYVVDPMTAGGLENMLKVTDLLVQKVRDERAARAASTK